MRNAAKITALTMAETVNSVIHYNTNHHVMSVMTFSFLILQGLLILGAKSLCKR